MSQKEKLTFKDGVKMVILLICTMGGLLGLVISVLGIVFWLTSGFFVGYFLASLFSFVIIVLPCSYVVTKLKPVWDKVGFRVGYVSTPPKEQAKSFLFFLVLLFVFFLLYRHFHGFIAPSLELIGVELAKDILRNIVQVNGILIGLSGIIYVQLLRMEFSTSKIITAVFIIVSMFTISMLSALSTMASTYGITEISWTEIEMFPLNLLLFGVVSFLISLLIITSTKDTNN